jgi:hypothetical protein
MDEIKPIMVRGPWGKLEDRAYRPSSTLISNGICFYPLQGVCSLSISFDATYPNVVERILGITYESKIDKARRKCLDLCIKMNKNLKESIDKYPLLFKD